MASIRMEVLGTSSPFSATTNKDKVSSPATKKTKRTPSQKKAEEEKAATKSKDEDIEYSVSTIVLLNNTTHYHNLVHANDLQYYTVERTSIVLYVL